MENRFEDLSLEIVKLERENKKIEEEKGFV